MDYDSWVIIALSLLFSAFFSGMEIAFVSANKLKVELDNKQGKWTARILSIFFKRPKLFIGAMLVGNNLALVFYGIEAGATTAQLIFGVEDWSMATTVSPYLVLAVQTIITTIIILITAEFLPKSIFRINPNGWLNVFCVPLLLLFYILFIPAWFVTGLSKIFLRSVFKANTENEEAVYGAVDLDHYLKEITQNMDPDEDLENEIQILQNALDFGQLKARDCLIPRNEIIAVDVEENLLDLRAKFIETGLSKVVVFRDSIDNIIGYVHVRDLFKKPEHITKILMPVFIIPEPMPANDILENFIKKKHNLAVVVDEFGGTSGIITIEDIVEEIFGEIEDEHDKEELVEKNLGPGHYQLSARLEIDYLNEEYDFKLPEHDDYDTLGGLIIHHTEDIPNVNDMITVDDYSIRVVRVNQARIELIELRFEVDD
ncbi:MAG: hemolysin family protein [Flavobacteriales bacterium]|nr:hemolysin family protein [Flavobacteriales bacterium]